MNKWININDRKPEWGSKVIVFRGKILIPHAYKFDFPKLVEYTNQFDDLVTHWMPLDSPIVGFYEIEKMGVNND